MGGGVFFQVQSCFWETKTYGRAAESALAEAKPVGYDDGSRYIYNLEL